MSKTITERVVARARKHYGLRIYTRNEWGSRAQHVYAARRTSRRVRVLKADTVAQHITVTRPSGDFKADVRVVERIGLDRFGSGVSYNFVVNMATGEIAVGQPLDAKGTHTVNLKKVGGYSYDQNHAARAIAVLGMPNTPLSDEAVDAIARLMAAMMDEEAITADPDYKPHSFFAWKDCPCEATRRRMAEILRLAKEYHSGKRLASEDKRPVVKLKRIRRAARRARWTRYMPATKRDVKVVRRALRREGHKTYRSWQKAVGAKKTDGLPRRYDLEALAEAQGFRVKAGRKKGD